MKACVYSSYGPPEVVKVKEIDIPAIGNHDILIKVYYSTVNRTDCGFRSAEYFISRFWSGLFSPKYKTLGCEFSGEIVAVGKDVEHFKIGDRVFGYNDKSFGSHAEFLCIGENDALCLIPQGITYEQAAAATEGSHYALCNIRASKIMQGQNALVYGATGAIGTAAVQLLKHFGIHVTAVCNQKNVTLVKSLGADVVIDYESEDFTTVDQKFNFVFDAVGKSSFTICKPLMTDKGIYISTELGKNGSNIFYAIIGKFSSGKKVLFPIPSIHKSDVEFLASLLHSGKFRPVIDRTFSQDQIVDAHKYVETGMKTGNVLLKIV